MTSPCTSAATGVVPHHAATASPERRPGSTAAFCSGEPEPARAEATTFTGTSGPGVTMRPISSATSTRSSSPCSLRLPPPSASGTSIEVQPSSAPRRHHRRSKPAGSCSSARTAGSGHSAARNLRVVPRKNSWSSLSSSSTPLPAAATFRRLRAGAYSHLTAMSLLLRGTQRCRLVSSTSRCSTPTTTCTRRKEALTKFLPEELRRRHRVRRGRRPHEDHREGPHQRLHPQPHLRPRGRAPAPRRSTSRSATPRASRRREIMGEPSTPSPRSGSPAPASS